MVSLLLMATCPMDAMEKPFARGPYLLEVHDLVHNEKHDLVHNEKYVSAGCEWFEGVAYNTVQLYRDKNDHNAYKVEAYAQVCETIVDIKPCREILMILVQTLNAYEAHEVCEAFKELPFADGNEQSHISK